MRLYLHITPMINHQQWGPSKSKRLEQKGFVKKALFRRCTSVDGAIKKQTVTAVHKVFLLSIIDHLTGSVEVMALDILQHLFRSYGAIKEIDLKENVVNIIGPYEPSEPLSCLIDQLKNGREFSRSGGQTITIVTMVSKGINLLEKTATFNDDIREWRQKSTKVKMCSNFKTLFYRPQRSKKSRNHHR